MKNQTSKKEIGKKLALFGAGAFLATGLGACAGPYYAAAPVYPPAYVEAPYYTGEVGLFVPRHGVRYIDGGVWVGGSPACPYARCVEIPMREVHRHARELRSVRPVYVYPRNDPAHFDHRWQERPRQPEGRDGRRDHDERHDRR